MLNNKVNQSLYRISLLLPHVPCFPVVMTTLAWTERAPHKYRYYFIYLSDGFEFCFVRTVPMYTAKRLRLPFWSVLFCPLLETPQSVYFVCINNASYAILVLLLWRGGPLRTQLSVSLASACGLGFLRMTGSASWLTRCLLWALCRRLLQPPL